MNIHGDSKGSSFNSASALRFQVLDLQVDAGRQTVTRGGSELHVPKLSFDLLLALVRAAPNTVGIPDLMERVWPNQVVGVETVTQRIKLLRRALSDEAGQPRYVSGERRRGYRVVAPVAILPLEELLPLAATEVNQPAPPPAAAFLPTTAPMRRGRLLAMLGIPIAVLVVAASTYRSLGHLLPDAQSPVVPPPSAAPYSVAVLPFQAISSGADDAQLGRGISELVTNRLTSEPELTVIASDSALATPLRVESAIEAGRRLGVHYVVDGSVQREGAQVRIAAQVIDVNEGRHLGALLVERPIEKLFSLEDDIAGRVTFVLLAKVHPEDASIQDFGAEATLAYLRARALLATRKVSETEAAIQEFTRVIAAAPTLASAYAGRADARFQRLFVVNAFNENAAQLIEEMRPDIDRALQLEPRNAPALFMRAKLREFIDDTVGAEADYRLAMAIDPGFASGVAYYADFLNAQSDDPAAALAVLEAGIAVNPMAPRLLYMKAEFISSSTHDDARAASLYMQTIQIAPDFYAAYNRLASMRWSEGHLTEAIALAEDSLRIDPDVSWSRENLARLYIDIGDLAAAREVLAHFREPSKHEGAALLCYREGRLDAAVSRLRSALISPHAPTGGATLAASITSLLEQAKRSGNYDSARSALIHMSGLTDHEGALRYNFVNALPLLQLATLEHLAGRKAEGDKIAARVLELRDDPTAQGNVAGRWERGRMLALALLGRDEEALGILEAQRETAARELWWVWIERHPAMQRLRGDPRVQQLLTEWRSWSRQERARLDDERRAGRLPSRTAQMTPDPCAPTALTALQTSSPQGLVSKP